MSSPDLVKFLIVDDLPENTRALEALLRQDGLQLDIAGSGTEALELLLLNDYALALLDVQMPDMNGFELAELMRGTERTRHVPIIFITAAATDEGRRFRGYEAGAVDYIFKPVDPIIVRSKATVFFEIGKQRNELNRQRDELQATSLKLGDALHRLQAHSDNSPLAIVEFDPDLRIIGWSKGGERMFGWTAREMVGRRLDDLGWLPDEETAHLLSVLTGSMADLSHRRGVETVRMAHRDGPILDCEWYSSVLRNGQGRPISLNVQILDVTERRRAEETQRLLIGELNHRVKNTLASVQAIATQTLRHTAGPGEFSETFSGRIQSLARAHGMLSDTTWQGARLDEIIRDQLQLGTLDETRIAISGPEVNLAPAPALRLALIVHELSTNANKYGALSTARGRIDLSWSVAGEQLSILWVESGGSGIKAPLRRGFGTTLIEQSIRADSGKAVSSYRSDGVTWEIDMLVTPTETTDLQRRIASASVVPEPPTRIRVASPVAGRKVLVVEDEPLVAIDLISILEDAGATVTGPVGAVSDALEAIAASRFDAAFLDGNLHGHPVDEVAAALTRSGVPFVFVTGYGRESLPPSFKEVGLVAKPFSPDGVLQAARGLLEEMPGAIPLRAWQ
ncbi:regulator [Nostoc sp. 3335mG]|nr:regulator [Nostoc sp. 3335mG]